MSEQNAAAHTATGTRAYCSECEITSEVNLKIVVGRGVKSPAPLNPALSSQVGSKYSFWHGPIYTAKLRLGTLAKSLKLLTFFVYRKGQRHKTATFEAL
jgi:hypothetical protein